ncbi:MAG TPA: YHS domain-containing protein [Gemmataceae bacterium]|nr:YHS domain-containing protein [Gemmataceae bacterium]
MRWLKTGACLALLLPWAVASFGADEVAKPRPVEALRGLNDLIGSWRGIGTPEGTREQKQRGFWTETIAWSWQFKDGDAWLKASFDKGKYFSSGELRYLPKGELYQLTLVTPAKEAQVFQGKLKNHQLLLERENHDKKQSERFVLSLLHSNRFLYRFEVKPQERSVFSRLYEVGATKEGEAFAGSGDATPACVVTGGKGTIKISYKGETFYVCCTGCRDAFKDNPEKFIKEYQERKAEEAKSKKR